MAWLKQLFSRRRRYNELSESIREHLDEKIADLMDHGMTREQAQRSARIEFGNVTRIEERSREVWQWPQFDSFWADIRYALRQLINSPGFTLTVILTLALGTGATTAIFSVINTVLVKPLPYKNPSRLVWITERFALAWSPGAVFGPDYVAWRQQNSSFEQIGAFQTGAPNTSLTTWGTPVVVRNTRVTPGFFSMLGVNPILGRSFTGTDDRNGNTHVALLSQGIWKAQFGANAKILGSVIHLNGSPYTVVGVLPQSLKYPRGDVWTPMSTDSATFMPNARPLAIVNVIGRLKEGVTASQAESNLQVVGQHIDSEYPQWFIRSRDRNVEVKPLNAFLVRNVHSLLLILLGVVGFVLLIACANVSNLLLSRATARGREFAVRAALGAGRVRMVRQSLTESLVLAGLGSALGLAGGLWFVRFLKHLIPPGIPSAVRFDPAIFGFAVGITIVATLVFGLVPALTASRIAASEALKSGGVRTGTGSGTRVFRNFLVVIEVTLSLIMLIGAGLLLQTFVRLSSVNLGFDSHDVVVADVSRQMTDGFNTPSQVPFFNQVLGRLQAEPGIVAAGASTLAPLSGCLTSSTYVYLPEPSGDKTLKSICSDAISPQYFHAIGIPLLAGRFFKTDDTSTSPNVVIINQALARMAFGKKSPIGQRLGLPGLHGTIWSTVVGVIGDARNDTLEQETSPEVFQPYTQSILPLSVTFVVRASHNLDSLPQEARNAVQAIDKDQAVSNLQKLDEVIAASMVMEHFRMVLLGFFALIAFVLASLGIFGTMSYSVSQRAQELAVRVALGAKRGDLIALVMGQGMLITSVGLAVGTIGALGLTRLLSTFLYGVKPADLPTFIASVALLAAAALTACYIPARRASTIDPMRVLRTE